MIRERFRAARRRLPACTRRGIVKHVRILPPCACVLVLTGCDLVFLEETTVRASFRERWAENAADGATVVDEVPAQPQPVRVTFEDGTTAPVEVAGDGELQFAVPSADSGYRLRVLFEDRPFEIQHTANDLVFTRRALGRRDRVAPAQRTDVHVPDLVSNLGRLVSTGVYTSTHLGSDVGLDWRDAASLSGPVGLLDASRHDRLYLFDREKLATPYTRLSRVVQLAPTMVDGGALTVPDAFMPLALDRCALVVGQREAVEQRLALLPDYTARLTNWAITAAPAPGLSPNGIVLANHDEVGPTTELRVEPTFPHPFPTMPLLASMRVQANRAYAYPGAAPRTLPAFIVVYDRLEAPDTACVSNSVLLRSSIAVPGDVAIGGVVIDRDDRELALPAAGPVAVTWEVAVEGEVDQWIATLIELQAADGVTQLRVAMTALVVDRRAVFDREDFAPGGYYLVRIEGRRGFPGARDGVFGEAAYPMEEVVVGSRMFRVAP